MENVAGLEHTKAGRDIQMTREIEFIVGVSETFGKSGADSALQATSVAKISLLDELTL